MQNETIEATIKAGEIINANISNKIVKEQPTLEDITIIPSKEEKIYKSTDYYGYSTVTVEKVPTSEITITPTATEQTIQPEDDSVGFSKVTVNGDENLVSDNIKKGASIFGVEGNIDTEGMINPSLIMQARYMFYDSTMTESPVLNLENCTSCYRMFGNCTNLIKVNELNAPKCTDFTNMFLNCSSLTEVPKINTTNGEDFSGMFEKCKKIKTLPQLDTANGKNFSSMFSNCTNLIEVPELDTSNATGIGDMFSFCTYLTTIPSLNTSNCTSFFQFFRDCQHLTDVPELDASKCINVFYMFYDVDKLINFGGLKNLGKAYSQKTANYRYYGLGLTFSSKLTHDSLMNVINNLYDLNLTYNVANGGTLYRQSLALGSTNLAKLTDEEIAIATDKGWNVT